MEATINTRLALNKKLAKVKFELGKIRKSLTNPYYNSNYFDINLLLDHVEESLVLNDLLLLQPIVDGYVVSQIIDLDSGEVNESSLKLPELNDPQKVGSAITFYRRYALQSQLGIRAEDDDANKASGKGDANTSGGNNSDQTQDNRPWLNENQLKKAIGRIKSGEPGVFEKMDKAFKMKKEYRAQLKAA